MTSSFPRSARLLSHRDFKFGRFKTRTIGPFLLVINPAGSGRIGVSIPKRIIKLAAGRNRVKRLWREAFRRKRLELSRLDIHVVARNQLGLIWRELGLEEVQQSLVTLISKGTY